jgi:ABC-type transport system involved in multi-copper enzyme maturation permease subunit
VPLTGATALILMALYQFVIPFAALLLGVAVLGDEIEGRTITYLFTRPLPRPVFYLGRLLGYITAFGILAVVSTYVTAYLFGNRVELTAAQVGGASLIAFCGFAVYTAFLAALRAFVEKAIYVGFFLVALLEWTLGFLPASGLSKCSVWHHLAVLQTRMFTPFQLTKIEELLVGIAPDETARGSIIALASIFLASAIAGAVAVRFKEVRVPAAVA